MEPGPQVAARPAWLLWRENLQINGASMCYPERETERERKRKRERHRERERD